MGSGSTPLPMGKPTKGISKTGKDMVSGFRLLKMGVSTKDNSLTINLKEKESCLWKTEQFIKDYLKMVKWKVQGFVRAKEKKSRALIF